MKNISRHKIRVSLANINAAVFFIGFPVYTSIFELAGYADNMGRSVITYRVLSFILAFCVIIMSRNIPKLNIYSKLFFFLWVSLIIRIVSDLYLRQDSMFIMPAQKIIYLNNALVVCFLPLISLFTSYKDIIWKKVFKSITFFLVFCAVLALIFNSGNVFAFRNRMNNSVNTLNYGYYSAALFLAGFTWLKSYKKTKTYHQILFLSLMILGIIGIASAGSRGPLFALLFAVTLKPALKNKTRSSIYLMIISISFFLYGGWINSIIQDIFPLLYSRTFLTVIEGSTNGREIIFYDAIAQIVSNPIIGDWHLLYFREDGIGNFAHNIILDTYMSLGIFIGSIIVLLYIYFVKISIRLISGNNIYSFIGYLTLLSIGYSLTTGGVLAYKDVFNFAFSMLLITTLVTNKIINHTNTENINVQNR